MTQGEIKEKNWFFSFVILIRIFNSKLPQSVFHFGFLPIPRLDCALIFNLIGIRKRISKVDVLSANDIIFIKTNFKMVSAPSERYF